MVTLVQVQAPNETLKSSHDVLDPMVIITPTPLSY